MHPLAQAPFGLGRLAHHSHRVVWSASRPARDSLLPVFSTLLLHSGLSGFNIRQYSGHKKILLIRRFSSSSPQRQHGKSLMSTPKLLLVNGETWSVNDYQPSEPCHCSDSDTAVTADAPQRRPAMLNCDAECDDGLEPSGASICSGKQNSSSLKLS